jgi:DNA-binding NarL/FixJ family response regulator
VGTAKDPGDAVALVRDLQPDMLIGEIETGVASAASLDHVREAKAASPGLKVIVVSAVDTRPEIEAAFEAGALAYVLKTAHADDVATAVRQAFGASIYFERPVETLAAAQTIAPAPATTVAAAEADVGLTRRELEILRLVAEGHSNVTLAKMLWVTEQTVKFHLSNIYRKLDVANRTEASRWAQMHGLLPAAMTA